MALSAILQPNSYKMYEGTSFVPSFVASEVTPNTYTNLGSMYIRSNDGNQVTVVSKIRVLSNAAQNMSASMTLPVPANATLNTVALFGPTPLVVASSGASTINVTNNVAGNAAGIVALTGASLANATTYNLTLIFSYNISAALN